MKDTFTHKGMRNKLIKTLKLKGIADKNVLEAIGIIPRHWFMDSGFIDHAYVDKAFPIGADKTISALYRRPTNRIIGSKKREKSARNRDREWLSMCGFARDGSESLYYRASE